MTKPNPFPHPVVAFDIETIPDIAQMRNHFGPDYRGGVTNDMTDEQVFDYAVADVVKKHPTRHPFLSPQFHTPIAVSLVGRTNAGLEIATLRSDQHTPRDLVSLFFNNAFRPHDRAHPVLVSWNGKAFDMPVMTLAALRHRVSAHYFWKSDGDFKWNNYRNKYHDRHADLKLLYGSFENSAPGLQDASFMMGLPGKIGVGGANVWDAYKANRMDDIANYCEVDALLVYLLYVELELVRGSITVDARDEEVDFVSANLIDKETEHWREFIAAWHESAKSGR